MKQTMKKEALQKKTYIAPKVMKVDLTSEEVMLGTCKASADSIVNNRTQTFGAPCQLCGPSFGS